MTRGIWLDELYSDFMKKFVSKWKKIETVEKFFVGKFWSYVRPYSGGYIHVLGGSTVKCERYSIWYQIFCFMIIIFLFPQDVSHLCVGCAHKWYNTHMCLFISSSDDFLFKLRCRCNIFAGNVGSHARMLEVLQRIWSRIRRRVWLLHLCRNFWKELQQGRFILNWSP